jgi:uncharacterized protein YdhG (YjbR/CyaY superfamily)
MPRGRARGPASTPPSEETGRERVDAYLAAVPGALRAALEELRRTIREAAPEAKEDISYQMPAFRQDGILVYYAAFTGHGSLFPASVGLLDKLERDVRPFRTSRGTLRFTVEHPLPKALVRKLVRARVAENTARAKAGQSRRR